MAWKSLAEVAAPLLRQLLAADAPTARSNNMTSTPWWYVEVTNEIGANTGPFASLADGPRVRQVNPRRCCLRMPYPPRHRARDHGGRAGSPRGQSGCSD